MLRATSSPRASREAIQPATSSADLQQTASPLLEAGGRDGTEEGFELEQGGEMGQHF